MGVGARSERGGIGVTVCCSAQGRVVGCQLPQSGGGCGWRGVRGGRRVIGGRCRDPVVREEGGRRRRRWGRGRRGGARGGCAGAIALGNRERAGAAAKGAGRAVGKRGAIEGAERGEGARLKR
uniref:Uncharacterized protein n=1 Tax=Oryza nivara TaxID=4536 RepID=A0A0E0HYA7_ORYNI